MLTMTAVGRLGRDVEIRYVQGNNGEQAVCNVSIGCNYGPKDHTGKQATQWVEGSLWGARAEAIAQYLVKGKQIILSLSDVHVETYEGANGTGTKLVGRVNDLAFGAEPRDSGGGQQGGGGQRGQGNQQRGGQGGGNRSQERPPARGQGGGDTTQNHGNRNGGQRGGQVQQPARGQTGGGGGSGFDDLPDDSDIPF